MSDDTMIKLSALATILASLAIGWFGVTSAVANPYKACKVVERLEDGYVLSCGFDDGFPQGYFDEKE